MAAQDTRRRLGAADEDGARRVAGQLAGSGIVLVSDFQNPVLAGRMLGLSGWRELSGDASGSVFVRRP